jgi:hypothetical protein
MNQQRGGGDAKIVIGQPAGLLFAARKIGDEILDGIKQGKISRKANRFASLGYLGTCRSGAIAIIGAGLIDAH